MMKRFSAALAVAVLIVVALTNPVAAVPVAVTDLDTITPGAIVVGPSVDSFDVAFPPPATMGSLSSTVYLGSGIYTYVFDVTPSLDNISEVNTGFNVVGFNGVAGYSFTDATTVGTGFTIDLDLDGTLDYSTSISGGFASGETVSFFFQSTIAPFLGDYNMINIEVGSATGFAPVPEPASLLLLGSGLACLGLWRRKRSKTMN